ncbi:MAG: cytidylate kinase-like family protein, partial [Gemmatimonadota bacterium]|nr:cytidylate kinase-like family protein [Gemmatimonadota bacterium]
MLITISRMYGSGGSEVAEGVARALGWELVDNAFVDEIASQLGMPASEVAEREERLPSLGSRIIKALSLSTPEAARTTAELPVQRSEEEIVAVTKRIITDAVQHGHKELVGRG